MLSEFMLEVLNHVWDALRSERVPAAVMGGIAVSAWEHFRATKDVGLLIGIESDDLERIMSRLADAGIYPRRDPPILTIGNLRIIQFRYKPLDWFMAVQIDLMIADSEFHRQALARRKPQRLTEHGRSIDVVAPEDLIILKLISGRMIDFADASYVLRYQRESMDMDYLAEWARRLQLTKELGQIWSEAFPGEPPPPC